MTMIYCVDPSLYPTPDRPAKEEVSYADENGFTWKIARIENGFFVRFFGDAYFQYKHFDCELHSGAHVRVRNTGCVFIQSPDFEEFAAVRTVLKNGYTDDIWEIFEDLFTERLNNDPGLIESEITKP